MQARLTIEAGEGTPPDCPIAPDKAVSLGRHRENTVVLQDRHASRKHAEILFEGGRWLVPGGTVAQCRQVMQNLAIVLRGAGTSLDRAVMARLGQYPAATALIDDPETVGWHVVAQGVEGENRWLLVGQ